MHDCVLQGCQYAPWVHKCGTKAQFVGVWYERRGVGVWVRRMGTTHGGGCGLRVRNRTAWVQFEGVLCECAKCGRSVVQGCAAQRFKGVQVSLWMASPSKTMPEKWTYLNQSLQQQGDGVRSTVEYETE
ncbi:hypothetical protein BU17DRAFT_61555 [Hysterangium stoloniferum]|nr:hypothetical protein BU17DRAFT_61555 [Hysterangium stoloniferum]